MTRASNATIIELARKGQALHYHAFSLMPLVTLAELGALRGQYLYPLNDGALHRLVAKTADGLNDPSIFDKLAGVAQQRPVNPASGWLALYETGFAGRLPDRPKQPDEHRWLGGKVYLLEDVLREAN